MPGPEGAQNRAMVLRILHRAESEVPIVRDADVIRTGMNLNVGRIGSVKVRGALERRGRWQRFKSRPVSCTTSRSFSRSIPFPSAWDQPPVAFELSRVRIRSAHGS